MALTHLREQTLPVMVEPPKFMARTAVLSPAEPILRLLRTLPGSAGAKPHLIASAAAIALAVLLATTISAWAALQPSTTSAPALPAVHSSAGTTGTAATRIENLSAATFVGGSPFAAQVHYMATVEGSTPQAFSFLQGAQESSVIGYIQDASAKVALPGLNDAIAQKRAVDQWVAAQEAQAEAQRLAALAPNYPGPVWHGSLATGTHLSSAVTFYACVGNGFCGTTASGVQVQPGVAACSYNLPFGTKFVVASDPTQRVFTCLDRGAHAPTWVDIWFYDVNEGYAWQALVGTHSDIIIVN